MNNLMKLYKNERTNDYFKNIAIMQIKVAHRIKEYLDPDKYFPPKSICESTMNLFLKKDVVKAVNNIFDEEFFDCDCSDYEVLKREAIEFAEELLHDYFERLNKELLIEREKLLSRLKEIDTQISKNR